MPTARELQSLIDSDANPVSIPEGTTALEVPLFVPSSKIVRGPGHQACRLQAAAWGLGLVVGWRRGLIDNTFRTAAGFRSNHAAHLWAKGTEWDRGPYGYYQGYGGWGSLTRLTVSFAATNHDADWRHGGTSETVLAGISGIRPGSFGPAPSPWLLWWTPAGQLTLTVKTADGADRSFVVTAADPATAALDVEVTIDFDAMTATATLGGSATPVDGPTLAPGLRLAGNDRWPFAALKGEPVCNSLGLSIGPNVPDCTLSRLEVRGPGGWFVRAFPQEAPPAPPPGGPSYPLLRCESAGGSRWLLAVHSSQGVDDQAGGVEIAGVEITSDVNTSPAVLLGSVQGGAWFDRCKFSGGSVGVMSSVLAVTYPVTVTNSQFDGQSDAGASLISAISRLSDVYFAYQRVRAAYFEGGSGRLERCFVAPPAVAQRAVVEQRGGDFTYFDLSANYEYAPAPPEVVRVHPASSETPAWPTLARLDACGKGTIPRLFSVSPRTPGYLGDVRVTVDGQVGYLSPQGAESAPPGV